ncbi:HNH endonuclease (plasmid) [halophilic archaeon DL31]|nr:HNH endonuclease [halophilic archaeon DL31]
MGKDYPSDWNSRRKKVYKRDNYRCQKCGSRGGSRGNTELHAHHKKPKSKGGSHRFSNLTTVCKSCHEDIHGHGVGGRSNSSSTNQATEELSPEELIAGLVGLSLLIAVIITGSAIMQVMPEGQTVSQSYELDYHLKNDPDSDMKYSLNNGRPLYIQHTIDDNKISEGGSTKISLRIENPSDRHLRGRITINRQVGWRGNEETLLTIDYNLPPETYQEETVTVQAENLYNPENSLPAESDLSYENEIWTDGYYALSAGQQGIGGDTITVRKHLFDRFGFIWLCFLSVGAIVGLGLRRWLQ